MFGVTIVSATILEELQKPDAPIWDKFLLSAQPSYCGTASVLGSEVSSVEIKPATNDRNDPATESCIRWYEERGIFLPNKPDSNELLRA
jgi:hypothetical protein